MVAYQVRVPEAEAEAFDALVERRSLAATGMPDGISASAVLRGLMKAAVDADLAASGPSPAGGSVPPQSAEARSHKRPLR